MRVNLLLLFVVILCGCGEPNSSSTANDNLNQARQTDELRERIHQLLSDKRADIGVAIIGPDGDTLSYHGDQHFPLMSVAKFPQALLLLRLVDEGKVSKDEPLHYTAEDMKQRTFSTLPRDHPENSFDLSIEESLNYSIGQSDNVTSNVIFAKEGGPKAVESFVRGLGISDFGLEVDYWHLNNETISSNWSTPKAMADLLHKFYHGEVLKAETKGILWEAMKNGPSGAKRLKYLLPEGTVVAHKTGTGDTEDGTGKIMALNDVGIVILPDGKPLTIAVFTANSLETSDSTEMVIAQLGKAAFDFFTGN